MKLAIHKQIWKPAFIPGGVVSATLCGRRSNVQTELANMNVGGDVSCQFCLSLLNSDRAHYNKRFIGLSQSEVEAISQERMKRF